jgi:class 3 adenylate cyclase/ABC-type sugar transport system permease subunit
MFYRTIRRKIVSIALALIVLMVITSVLSMYMTSTVAHLLDELGTKYIPAYGQLARANIRSLERAVALQQMVIARMQTPPDEETYASLLKIYQEKDPEIERETDVARKLINSIIDDPSTPSDNAALGRIDDKIDNAIHDIHKRLNDESDRVLGKLEQKDFASVRGSLARADKLREEFTDKIDGIRADMFKQVFASSRVVIRNQWQTMVISAILTALAATIGLGFAWLVSSGISRPVRQLLEGTRDIEAGRLDRPISVNTRDEIGELTAAFNRMVEQLRRNEQIRETFGRYFDPKIVAGIVDQPGGVGTEGQRQVMTVLFCDMKGFTHLSEGVTPQGLVKIMNFYLSTMSEPIREHRGIIDKYIGDAIMAYWGAPFVEESEHARLACLAAAGMIDRVTTLRKELPEILGVRSIPMECDIRIGIATGEVLAGSMGSKFMMSYTIMGDKVNLASRLEVANKEYGTRSLVSETTIAAAGDAVEAREIDRLVVLGQTRPQAVFEVLGKQGALTANQVALRNCYAEGLAAYRACRWEEARNAFNAALEAAPDDGPSLTLLGRIEKLESNPPPSDWDGAWQMDHK